MLSMRESHIGWPLCITVFMAQAILTGCATPSASDIASDSTPSELLELRVVYQRVSDGLEVGSEVIPSSGFTRRNISRNNRIILSSVAVDGQSGVATTRLGFGEMQWACSNPNTELAQLKTATLDKRSDEERRGSAAAGLPYIRASHFSFDPFDGNPLRLVCASTDESSTLSVNLTVATVNGKGVKTTSGPIEFSYLPRAATLPPATSDFCGDNSGGQIFACSAEKICAPRKSTACSGWWIFKTCDSIQTTDLFCQ
jgi:hypothetical protein